MDSSIKKALKRYDKNKPTLKCSNCGMWKNIEINDKNLFKKLGYYICMNCGKIIKENIPILKKRFIY